MTAEKVEKTEKKKKMLHFTFYVLWLSATKPRRASQGKFTWGLRKLLVVTEPRIDLLSPLILRCSKLTVPPGWIDA